MNITILSDNIAEPPFQAEHGLAYLIEINGKRVLFDSGQGEPFVHNCATLGVAFETLDAVVLSHGHYDHGGNLATVLEHTKAPFFAHPSVMIPRFSNHEGKPSKSVAIPNSAKMAIMNLPVNRHRWIHGITEIVLGLFATGPIPRITDFETVGGPFFLDSNSQKPDLLPDDLALFTDTPEGLVVITGCCHSGIVNTLEFITSKVDRPIHTVIGGLHLLNADQNRLDKTVEYLNEKRVQQIIPIHCTGELAIPVLEKSCSAEMVHGSCGFQFQIE